MPNILSFNSVYSFLLALFLDLLDPDPGGHRMRIQNGSESETLPDSISHIQNVNSKM
jgi:hypothetical protein